MTNLNGGSPSNYQVKLSARGFDVHDHTIGGQIVFTAQSRPAARLVAEALADGRVTHSEVVHWSKLSLAEVRHRLKAESS